MRYILMIFVIFIGAQIGLNAINSLKEIQNEKLDQICKIDPSYCQPNSK